MKTDLSTVTTFPIDNTSTISNGMTQFCMEVELKPGVDQNLALSVIALTKGVDTVMQLLGQGSFQYALLVFTDDFTGPHPKFDANRVYTALQEKGVSIKTFRPVGLVVHKTGS